jgi:alpha-1,3-glucosyltransferase
MPLILAPTPRRHLIDNSASQHWLHSSYLSPPSSRPISPLSQASQQHDDWNGSGSDIAHSSEKISTSSKNQPTTSPSFRQSVVPNTVRRRMISNSVSLQSRNIHEFFEPKQDQMQRKNNETAHLSDSTDTAQGTSYRCVEKRRNPGQGEGLMQMGTPEPMEPAMGRRWLRWMHKTGLKQWVLPGIMGASTLVKLLIGLGPYSGSCFWLL